MPLVALIAAYHDDSGPGDGLRATLPLAGRTLVERQARLAAAAGAERILVLIERVTPELVAAIDRVRAAGIGVGVARSVAAVAEAVDPAERVLLVADGLLADAAEIERIGAVEAPAILVVADLPEHQRFERIDADSRWAGLALIDGALLRDTARMLSDWDLQSTLLRRAVQDGAERIAADAPPRLAERPADLQSLEQAIVAAADRPRGGWASRYLLAPIERLATRYAMPTAITPDWLRLGAGILTAIGAVAIYQGWLLTGGALVLLATPLDGIADRIAALRMEAARERRWTGAMLQALSGLALLALADRLADASGWGALVLAVAALVAMAALRTERAALAEADRLWLADRKGLTWLMLPFAVAGWWMSGLGLLAAYAAGSLLWAQHRVHGSRRRHGD